MDQQRIKALIDLLSHSDLTELSITEGPCTLTLVRDTAAAPSVPARTEQTDTAINTAVPSADNAAAHDISAPLYGIFHITSAPGAAPFVVEGDSVVEGQPLAMIEAMKMFHTIEADRAGTIAAILATPGHDVDAGQPLFRIV